MKILIVTYSVAYGGAERQVIIDANSLSAAGHEVAIVYYAKGDLINSLSANVKRYRLKSKNHILASLQLFCYLLFNKFDIIHCHLIWAEIVAALPGKITGHKVIFNEHGLDLWRRRHYVLISRFIFLFADKIVASCEAIRKVISEREKPRKDKLVVIYTSFDRKKDKNKEEDIPEFLKSKKEFTIGFVGRFDAIKRLKLFVDIAEQLKGKIPAFKIVLVGDGAERLRIIDEMQKRNLSEYFYLSGTVPDVNPYYAAFDVFVLPSLREGASVALLEAGASGIPAIAFDVGGNPELIQDGVTGYIIPFNNITLLTDRIVELYGNKDKRKTMSLSAGDFVKNNFSTAVRIEKLINLYNEVISNA